MSSEERSSIAQRPIGVFDSGLGGLTVAGAMATAMPHEEIVYLGDSARVPYGIKSLETVRRFAHEDAAFLLRFNPKLIVVACNTASAAAVATLRESLEVPVVDVIAPGVAEAMAGTEGPIGVIATEATIRSQAYQRAIAARDPGREVVTAYCPLLVPIVEEGRDQDDPIVLSVLHDYLRDLQRARPTVLILGCTHYPLLRGAIGKLMGPGTRLVNSGAATASEVRRRLRDSGQARGADCPGGIRCFTTDNPRRFQTLAERFSGRPIEHVEFVGTDELERPLPAGS